MFCPECGTKLDHDAHFCPQCGTKVMFEETSITSECTTERANADMLRVQMAGNMCTADAAHTECKIVIRGFILTNLRTLSKRLGVETGDLCGLLNGYISGMRNLGVQYTLLDAGDYTYKTRSLLGGHKHVSLNQNNAWYEYADILKDAHDAEVKSRLPESDYLFIIGGDKDVPMACVPNVFGNADKDVDTDLLYAYPYGKEMEEKLLTLELFSYDAMFYIGRLPVADDGTADDIARYLSRILENGAAVPVDRAYTQSDPAWYQMTMAITEDLAQCGLYPSVPANMPRGIIADGRVFLTPEVRADEQTGYSNIAVFDKDANYYFFNMHGSNALRSAAFYGEDPGIDFPAGVTPAHIAASRCPNIFFTQACYGGRFIGYPKQLSMLHTALNSNTLAYVGSSRVAYGGGIPKDIGASDILGLAFNRNMLSGSTTGAAFFAARVQTFLHSRGGMPTDSLTVIEFNLYGDPVVHIGGYERNSETDKHAVLAKGEKVGIVRHETLYDKSADAPQSLLSRVRQAVDKNILDISAVITKQLYEQYGVSAREPSIIERCTFADGHKELAFTYSMHTPCTCGIVNEVNVSAMENGEVRYVTMTK